MTGGGSAEQLPPVLAELAAERGLHSAALVWRNALGGLTFQFRGSDGDSFAKWLPVHPEFDVRTEAARLCWAGPYVPVPEVLGFGEAGDGSWLWTRALSGTSAVDPRWRGRPALAARAIGVGLRLLHDRLPVDGCPFGWSVTDRLAHAGVVDPVLVADAPPIDRLVVCHGDACVPNTLLAEDGSYIGTVDLGSLGTADRWADLAVATYSLGRDFPGAWAKELLDAYGIDADQPRLQYYRRLWDAT